MREAAYGGHVEIIKLCREYGETDFDGAMGWAASRGHIEIVKLCREYGATSIGEAARSAAFEGHIEIVKLCRSWLGYDSVHHDLLRHLHQRSFAGKIYDELLPVAWHPDRFLNWCIDEEEKGFLEKMWGPRVTLVDSRD